MTINDIEIKKADEMDLQGIKELLKTVNDSIEDGEGSLDVSLAVPAESIFLIAKENDEIIGTVGLEVYESVALLRSLAVHPKYHDKGLGRALTRKILYHAKVIQNEEIYLLTETAKDFFTRFGFKIIANDLVNPLVKESSQFKGTCPDTATIMRKTVAS
ncbi:MAG: GNAT family N-acetyltransferase [Candidatus Hodarchaeales archaeon]|jgi:amino-acid N-acetyltransferase